MAWSKVKVHGTSFIIKDPKLEMVTTTLQLRMNKVPCTLTFDQAILNYSTRVQQTNDGKKAVPVRERRQVKQPVSKLKGCADVLGIMILLDDFTCPIFLPGWFWPTFALLRSSSSRDPPVMVALVPWVTALITDWSPSVFVAETATVLASRSCILWFYSTHRVLRSSCSWGLTWLIFLFFFESW